MYKHIDRCVWPGNPRLSLDHPKVIDADTSDFSAENIRMEKKEVIGVIGLGSVGHALGTIMGYFYDVVGYDIVGDYDWNKILICKAVFVCVQTPSSSDGRLDCSRVSDVLARLSDSDYDGVVVIKSTLGLGYMDEVRSEFPDLRLVYSPEFLREKSALVWTASPDRLVLSGEQRDVEIVKDLYHWVEDAEIIITDYKTAELGKLLHNAYIAVKVTFTNSAELMAKKIGADATVAMNIVSSDRRIKSKEHLTPFKGPYGGKCVPKDTSELTHYFENEASLIRAAEEFNKDLLSKNFDLASQRLERGRE